MTDTNPTPADPGDALRWIAKRCTPEQALAWRNNRERPDEALKQAAEAAHDMSGCARTALATLSRPESAPSLWDELLRLCNEHGEIVMGPMGAGLGWRVHPDEPWRVLSCPEPEPAPDGLRSDALVQQIYCMLWDKLALSNDNCVNVMAAAIDIAAIATLRQHDRGAAREPYIVYCTCDEVCPLHGTASKGEVTPPTCSLCNGSRRIIEVVDDAVQALDRHIPCPKCSPEAEVERVAVLNDLKRGKTMIQGGVVQIYAGLYYRVLAALSLRSPDDEVVEALQALVGAVEGHFAGVALGHAKHVLAKLNPPAEGEGK